MHAMVHKRLILIISISVMILSLARSQDEESLLQENLRFYLSEDHSSFAGLVMVNQIWTRYRWNNPGTLDETGNPMDRTFDVGLRRSRLIFYTRLFDRFFMYTQIGYNGQTYASPKAPGIFVHNAVTEYLLDKEKVHLGFGLHTYNGISRYNNSKLIEFLVVDHPSFVYPIGGTYDQAGRQFGIYAKGTLSKLHYRVSLSKPFLVDNTPLLYEGRTVEVFSENLAYKGYFDWQFWDTESHMLPYMSMNNLEKKKLLNLGGGFYMQPEATQSIRQADTVLHDISLWGIDAFLDLPLDGGGILTAYLTWLNYDFGPNYLRAAGKLNSGTGSPLEQGNGIAEWEVGTGTIIRFETGYAFPWKTLLGNLQPFAGLSYKDFDALEESSIQYDLGFNCLMYTNRLKWTLQYSTRPVYEGTIANNDTSLSEYKGVLVLQTQFWF